jgi:hypothetical protein
MPASALQALDALATERGVTRSRLVRQVLSEATRGKAPEPPETPGEAELLALLSEKAREGNLAAIRSLLAREAEVDPRERALMALESLARQRRQ